MIKQFFSFQTEEPRAPERIRASSVLLALYAALLPVTTALTGLIGEKSTLSIIAALYLLAAIIEQFFRPWPLFKKELLFVYAYFCYSMLSFLWLDNKQIDWYLTTFLTAAMMFVIASGRSYNEKELKLFFRASLLSILIVFSAVAANFSSAMECRLEITIIQSMDPNFFGCGLCVVIAMSMASCMEKKKHWMVIFAPMLFFVILLTGSRGAMLVGAGMLFCWTLAAISRKKYFLPIITVLLTYLFFIIFTYCVKSIGHSTLLIDRVNPKTLAEDSGAGRLQIWMAAFDTFLEAGPMRKIFGFGHGGFRAAVNYIAPGYTNPYSSHNMYVNALIEGGVVGLILLLLAFIQIFFFAVKRRNLWGALAVIGFALEGVSLDAQIYQVFPWAFIVAALFKGGDDYEILLAPSGDSDRSGLQS